MAILETRPRNTFYLMMCDCQPAALTIQRRCQILPQPRLPLVLHKQKEWFGPALHEEGALLHEDEGGPYPGLALAKGPAKLREQWILRNGATVKSTDASL